MAGVFRPGPDRLRRLHFDPEEPGVAGSRSDGEEMAEWWS